MGTERKKQKWRVRDMEGKKKRKRVGENKQNQKVGNGTGASSLRIWTGVDYPVGTITASFSCLCDWNKNDKTALSEPTGAEPKLVIPACETKSVLKIPINCICLAEVSGLMAPVDGSIFSVTELKLMTTPLSLHFMSKCLQLPPQQVQL